MIAYKDQEPHILSTELFVLILDLSLHVPLYLSLTLTHRASQHPVSTTLSCLVSIFLPVLFFSHCIYDRTSKVRSSSLWKTYIYIFSYPSSLTFSPPVMYYPRFPACIAISLVLSLFGSPSTALRFNEEYSNYNLNQNQTAVDVSDYYGIWDNHTFFPSPSNWRVPFYTLFLDKFVNGDPTNDDINGTLFEHDVM